jgi:hypothetical protein
MASIAPVRRGDHGSTGLMRHFLRVLFALRVLHRVQQEVAMAVGSKGYLSKARLGGSAALVQLRQLLHLPLRREPQLAARRHA